MNELPPEIVTLIFSFFDVWELRAVRLVCRKWLEAVTDSRVVFWNGSVNSRVLGWFSHPGLVVRGIVDIRGHDVLRNLTLRGTHVSSLSYHIYSDRDRSFFFEEWLPSSDSSRYTHLEVTDEEVVEARKTKNRIALFAFGISGLPVDVSIYLITWASQNRARSFFLNRAGILAYRDGVLFHVPGTINSPLSYSLLMTAIQTLKPHIVYTSDVLDFGTIYPTLIVKIGESNQRDLSALISFSRGT